MQGLATLNLLRQINRQRHALDDLAPEVEAPPASALPPPSTARLIFQGLLIVTFFVGLFALAMRDQEIRDRRDRALIEAANRPLAEICEHLELTNTPYTFAVCSQKNTAGKVIYRREGM